LLDLRYQMASRCPTDTAGRTIQTCEGRWAGLIRSDSVCTRVRCVPCRGSKSKGYAGYFVVEVLSQALWRDSPLAVARRCHAGAVKVLESV
jgi:hypothetical protein